MAPLKQFVGLSHRLVGRSRIPRVLSVAPLKRRVHGADNSNDGYSTRPKRGPIEALIDRPAFFRTFPYSTRPKRGPIEAADR